MGIQKKGLGVLCLLLTLCLLLSGCRESSSLVRYDISNGVESLDPQFASEENEQLVIYNMMEGLMRQKPSGELTNGAIERYEVAELQRAACINMWYPMTFTIGSKSMEAADISRILYALSRLRP